MRARSLSLSLSSLLSALESNGRTFRCFSTATQYQLVHCITTFFSLSLILSFNNLILYGFHVCFHPISSRFRWINTHFLPAVDHILNLCSLFVACCIFAISSIFGPFFPFSFWAGFCRVYITDAFYSVLWYHSFFTFVQWKGRGIIERKQAIKMGRNEEWILMLFGYNFFLVRLSVDFGIEDTATTTTKKWRSWERSWCTSRFTKSKWN